MAATATPACREVLDDCAVVNLGDLLSLGRKGVAVGKEKLVVCRTVVDGANAEHDCQEATVKRNQSAISRLMLFGSL